MRWRIGHPDPVPGSLILRQWTDSFDRAVARRSLGPRDYLGKTPGRGEGMSPSSEVTVRAAFDMGNSKASWYRLRLYYP